MTKPIKAPPPALPPSVTAADLSYPKPGKGLPYADLNALGLQTASLTFHRTAKFGWVLATLFISNPSRRQAGTVARTYAIGVADGKLYTVGCGPHVLQTVEVYLSADNRDRLQVYADLWRKGMAAAGEVRDRISSRRAQGQAYRAEGRTSWQW